MTRGLPVPGATIWAWLSWAGLVLAAQPLVAQEAEPPRESFEEIVNRPIVYALPGMDAVRVERDLPYADAADSLRRMDVYIPAGLADGERRPVVLFVHGGTSIETRPKDWGIYVSWGRLVAAYGFVGVTFTHRLGFPDPTLEKAAADVESALAYVRKRADALRADPERVCLAVYSAGGPLLTVALRTPRPAIRCLLAFYAFLDVQQSSFHQQYETPETIRSFSPIAWVEDGAAFPPLFIARAGRDEIPTMNDSIDRFVAAALAHSVAFELMAHPSGLHGFDNRNDDDRSREIIARALDFMAWHLRDDR